VLTGGLGFPAEAIVAIGSHPFASWRDRMAVGNFTRSGERLFAW
jgi:hypothetical protein